jgi:hypothetical protein
MRKPIPHTLDETGIRLFWAKVQKPEGETGCWHCGRQNTFTYGGFKYKGRSYNVHRLAYELLVGPIDSDFVMRHQCPNKWCCNPAHLIPGTQSENAQDRWDIELGRKTYI